MLPSLIAIDDRKYLVATFGWIPAHIVVIDLHDERVIPYHAAQQLGYIAGLAVQAILRARDLEITVTTRGNAGVPWIPGVPRISPDFPRVASAAAVIVELAGIDIGALFVGQLANLPLHVPRGKAQNLIRADRWIAAQVGIVHFDHAVPREQCTDPISDIHTAIPRAPVGLHHLQSGAAAIANATAIVVELARIDGITLIESKLTRLTPRILRLIRKILLGSPPGWPRLALFT